MKFKINYCNLKKFMGSCVSSLSSATLEGTSRSKEPYVQLSSELQQAKIEISRLHSVISEMVPKIVHESTRAELAAAQRTLEASQIVLINHKHEVENLTKNLENFAHLVLINSPPANPVPQPMDQDQSPSQRSRSALSGVQTVNRKYIRPPAGIVM